MSRARSTSRSIAPGLATIALMAVVAVGFFALRPAPAGTEVDPQDAFKARHAAEVVAELRARDVSHLSPEQRANRARNLDLLAAYGEAGRFAQNEDYPGEAIPHLIDAHGTRCALANLIDRTGHDDLLLRLARKNNIAFVPELKHDLELGRWLEAQGLTVDEAAYIQGPGFVDPVGPTPIPPDLRDPNRGDPTTPGQNDPVTPSGDPAAPTTPSGPQGPSADAPTTGSDRGRGRRPRGSTAADWETWWQLNRHAYLNLRARYHDGAVVTGTGRKTRVNRPTEAELDTGVMPLLSTLARNPDSRVRATALMAWARAARPRHAPEVVEAVLTYLRDESNQFRDMMILALGVVGHENAVGPLKEILADSKAGRKILARKGSITERTRAIAAIALGQSGDTGAVADLKAVLEDDKHKVVDLKAACVLSLGTLARDCEQGRCRQICGYLVKQLREDKWPNVVLAAIPTALATAGDESVVVATVQPMLQKFRKPHLARQSSALAVGTVGAKATPKLVDTLIATARRDPNDTARRFGIVALGEIAAANAASAKPRRADPESGAADETRAAVGNKFVQYYKGAFAGRNIQKTDMPWLCLSAALFARGYPEHHDWVASEIRPIAEKASSKDRQAAGIVALGIMGDKASLKMLVKLYEGMKDKHVKGYLVETLGVLGDRTQRDALLELVKTDGSGEVRYRAALGLGFSADRNVVKTLAQELGTTSSGEAKVAIARVLGELGDRSVLAALVRVAADEKADTWTRRRALGAIGMIAEEDDHAWTTEIRRGVNFPVATPTVRLVLSLF